MRTVLKYIINRTYRPLLVKYLAGDRTWSWKGITLSIPSGVFHPAFFFSSKLLMRYLSSMPLEHRRFLELGAGSGLLSVYAARQGATVTATDISPDAIRALHMNRTLNEVSFDIVRSDVFKNIPVRHFDIIVINPPYYRDDPDSYAEHAWYCGKDGKFFTDLFSGLADFTHRQSEVIMILCDGCDINMVREISGRYGFHMNCVSVHSNLMEQNFIYRIEPMAAHA
ncbi:MAG TPA: methyltransferase [Flavisolibacter sp.]